MSSDEGSAASSYDSVVYGDVARAGFSRMYILSHSALSPLDLSVDYRGDRGELDDQEAKEQGLTGRRKRYEDLENEYEQEDGFPRFQLLYMNGRHYFHGTISLPQDDPECQSGWVDQADCINAEDLPFLLPHFQQQQDELTCIDHVTHFRQELRDVIYQMEEVGEFMVEELSKDKIIDRIEEGSKEFHWMVSPHNPTFFELQTYPSTNESFAEAGVVIIVLKIVVRGVLLDVIYHNDSYFITLRENAEELALEDTFVPSISRLGPCYLVRRYSDEDLKQLLLWCSFPPDSEFIVEGKKAISIQKESDEQLHLPAQKPLNILKVAPIRSSNVESILEANDSQFYCLFPTVSSRSKRKRKQIDKDDGDDEDPDQMCNVVFQFNQYIYNGTARLRISAMNDLGRLSSHVLPSLKIQALESLTFFGSLANSADATELPTSIRWMNHVRDRFSEISLTLMELVTDSQTWVERFLAEVDIAANESANTGENAEWLGSHLRGWLDNGDGTEYFFELETKISPTRLWGSREDEEHDELKSSDVNLMLWKGIVNQVIVVIVYRRGSFFIVLRELKDVVHMPTEGLEFFGMLPELDSKGRGYLVKKFPLKIERRSQQWLSGAKLLLWQTTGSVAREDIAAEEAQAKWLRSPTKQDEEKKTSAWFEEKDSDQTRSGVRKPMRVDDEDSKLAESASVVLNQRDKSGKRHHLAPLSNGVRSGGAALIAPWDLCTGRPV